MYEKLFEKGRIGNVELKNRLVMTPMGTNLAELDDACLFRGEGKGRMRTDHA